MSSTTSVIVSYGSRSASRTASRCSARTPTSPPAFRMYDPATESEIAWNDPDVGVEWPVEDPLLSERDKEAPRLAEVAAELPFEYA